MADLTTLEKVKQYMRITGDKDDEMLSRLISSTSTFIQSWLNRDLSVQTYTDKFSGTNQEYHVCKNFPILEVQEVKVTSQNIDGFDFDEDTIFLTDKSFYKGRHNCEITYTAGYEEIPQDIQQACIEIVAIKYKQIESINLTSKAMGGETTSFMVKDMPDFAKVVLNQYKRVF